MYEFITLPKKDRLGEEKKRNILKELRLRRTPDDVIAAMLSFLETEEIPADYEKIHSAINYLKNDYPELLGEFVFSKGDIYPFSKLLERVLFRLQNGGIISTVNPDFKRCIIPANSRNYIRRNILPLFSDEEKRKLKEMSKKFHSLIIER
jgi:hypothetical protein